MKEIFLDVMDANGRFICQVKFRYWAAFPVSEKDLYDAIYEKRPSLRGKTISIGFSNQKTHA